MTAAVISPDPRRALLTRIEIVALRHGDRRRREHFDWAFAAYLWREKVRPYDRPELLTELCAKHGG